MYKRTTYYEILRALNYQMFVVLCGPRKCGKTIVLKQLARDESYTYYDIKSMNVEKQYTTIEYICKVIRSGAKRVFLLDEYNYLPNPDLQFESLVQAHNDNLESETKVVITGSQTFSIMYWANRSLSGCYAKVNMGFIGYAEWLSYKEEYRVNNDTFNDYIQHVHEFFGFDSLKEYLQGCLDETVVSNANVSNFIPRNDISDVTIEDLVTILYTALFSLHNAVGNKNGSENLLARNLRYHFNDIKYQTIQKEIEQTFLSKYNHIHQMNYVRLYQCLTFLYNCDLVVINNFSDNVCGGKDYNSYITSYKASNELIYEFLHNFKVTIKYPFFYMAVAKEVLGDLVDKIPQVLLGSMYECMIRSYFNDAFTYHNNANKEVDIVSISKNVAIETTVSTKPLVATALNDLPYRKILTTKNSTHLQNDVCVVNYAELAYALSYTYATKKDFFNIITEFPRFYKCNVKVLRTLPNTETEYKEEFVKYCNFIPDVPVPDDYNLVTDIDRNFFLTTYSDIK